VLGAIAPPAALLAVYESGPARTWPAVRDHETACRESPRGPYCAAGDFYIDPWLPVREAVVTHAHSDHARPGSEHYHCAAAGLPLLRWRLGEQKFFAHDYGDCFELGRAQLSLHPAGHMLGSAQVRIESGGQCWVVSGDYKREPDPTCAPFEALACDGLLTEATFALPVYRWMPTHDVVDEILDWWQACRAREETALLFCYALGKAQRLLAEMAVRLPRRPGLSIRLPARRHGRAHCDLSRRPA
jgi:putative mRNA 3-end processing factor